MLNSSGKDCKSDEMGNRSSAAPEDLGQLFIFLWSLSLLKKAAAGLSVPPVSPCPAGAILRMCQARLFLGEVSPGAPCPEARCKV